MDDNHEETLQLLLTRPLRRARRGAGVAGDDDNNNKEENDDGELTRRLWKVAEQLVQEPLDPAISEHWDALIRDVQGLGFSWNATAQQPSSSSSALAAAAPNPTTALVPPGFDTDEGKAHLRAVSQLLGLSANDAARITLSALAAHRSLGTNSTTTTTSTSSLDDDPRHWIGSRALLEMVLEYGYTQRTARLQLVAECLRLEQQQPQDSSNNDNENKNDDVWRDEVLVPVLQQVDGNLTVQDPFEEKALPRHRGLFRLCVSLATQPLTIPWTRQQLDVCRILTETTSSSSSSVEGTLFSQSSSSQTASWDAYVHRLMRNKLVAIAHERLQALEALVALLYARMDGGVRRSDYALLIRALQSANHFYTNTTKTTSATTTTIAAAAAASSPFDAQRLQCLAGLLCIEGTGLWRVADTPPEDSAVGAAQWVEQHPLLLGLLVDRRSGGTGAEQVETELEAILTLLRQLGRQVSVRQQSHPEQLDSSAVAPEGLALFSFGLLLSSAHRDLLASEQYGSNASAYWQTFQDSGSELSRYANDVCQALEYIDVVMNCLVDVPSFVVTRKTSNSLEPLLHDVEFDSPVKVPRRHDDDERMADDDGGEADGAERELNGPSLIYASIGRELLVAMVVVYRDTILSVHHPGALDNLRMLSQLSTHLFCNSPTLCIPFWDDWYTYHAGSPTPEADANNMSLPLCSLLDSASYFAKAAVSSSQPPVQVLEAAIPLLKLVSCLAYDATIAKFVLTQVLPPNTIHTALEACSSLSRSDSSADLIVEVLASVTLLAQVGNSKTTRQELRSSMDDMSNHSSTYSPRSVPSLLISLVDAHPNSVQLAGWVDTLLSVLLLDAPLTWIIDAAVALQSLARHPIPSSSLPKDHERVESTLRLVHCFVHRMLPVLIHEEHDDSSKQAYLKYLEQGLTLACSVSVESMAPFRITSSSVPYETVLIALECLESFLSAVLVFSHLLDDGVNAIGATVEQLRLVVLNRLATNRELGSAVWYYSGCLVSLILASDLVDVLRDVKSVSESTTLRDGPSTASSNAQWQIADSYSEQQSLRKAGAMFEKSAFLSSKGYDVDTEGVIKKGWIRPDDEAVLFRVSLAALQLLNTWARNAEIVVMRNNMDCSWLSLSPFYLLLKQSVVPPLCRTEQHLAKVWNSSGLTNMNVLLHCIASNGSRLPVPLSTAAFDLLFLSLFHSKKLLRTDSSVFHACSSSALFRDAVEESLAIVSKVSEVNQSTLASSVKISNVWRLFQAVSLCIDSSPRTVSALFGANPSNKTATLFRIVAQVIEELLQLAAPQQRNHTSVIFDDVELVDRLKLGNACLSLIQSLWKVARSDAAAMSELKWVEKSINEESSSLSQFSRMAFRTSRLWFIDANTEAMQLGQRLCFNLASLCLELVSAEIRWTCTTLPSLTPDSPLVMALQVAVDPQHSLIIGKTREYSTFLTLKRFSVLLKRFGDATRLGESLSAKLDLRALTSAESIIMPHGIPEMNGFDVFTSPGLRSLVSLLEFSRADSHVALRDLAMTNGLLKSELRRIQAWDSFLESFSMLLRSQILENKLHIPTSLSVDIGKEISRALHDNLSQVEEAKQERLLSLELNDFLNVVGSSSRLLLLYAFAVVSVEKTQSEDEHLGSLASLSNSAMKLVAILGTQLLLGYEAVQHLVAAAAALLSVARTSRSHQRSQKFEEVCLSLATTCCALINSASATSKQIGFSDCFCTCLSLLTGLTVNSHGNDLESENLPYLGNLYNIFRDTMVTASVLRQVSSFSNYIQTIEANCLSHSVCFLTSMASLGDSRFMELVIEVAPRVLAMCAAHYVSLRNETMQGHGSSLSGATADLKRDVFCHQGGHESWLEGLNFLSAVLVSSNSMPAPTRRSLFAVATDFLNSHKGLIRSRFQQICDKAPGLSSPVFTLSSLHEAKLLLSILSDVSTCQGGTPLESDSTELFSTVLSCSISLLASIGSFLGASAASRGLFKLLNEYESAGEVADLQLLPLSPLYHLMMTSGVPTAKHEAIRFSHFASRSTKASNESEMKAQEEVVTNWGLSLAEQAADSRSLSNLQHSCRRSVTSQFAFSIEFAAAEALFFAVHFLRNVHPSSHCFVPFSGSEAQNVDAFALVHPGVVISFRPPTSSSLDGFAVSPGVESKEPAISYAEVLHSDTVRRQWRVRELGKKVGGERVVSYHQLAGIEDTTKRQCLLAYAPAPETSSDLETAMGIPSVGHLILALRWCDQVQSEIRSSSPLAHRSVIVQRLAEIVAALLGTEVSLHKLIGSHGNASRSGTLQVFTSQLADLFGDVVVGDPVSSPRGRLQEMLGDAVVPKICELFRADLEMMRSQAELNRTSPRHRTGIDSWHGLGKGGGSERPVSSK